MAVPKRTRLPTNWREPLKPPFPTAREANIKAVNDRFEELAKNELGRAPMDLAFEFLLLAVRSEEMGAGIMVECAEKAVAVLAAVGLDPQKLLGRGFKVTKQISDGPEVELELWTYVELRTHTERLSGARKRARESQGTAQELPGNENTSEDTPRAD